MAIRVLINLGTNIVKVECNAKKQSLICFFIAEAHPTFSGQNIFFGVVAWNSFKYNGVE